MYFEFLEQIIFHSNTSLQSVLTAFKKTTILTGGRGFGIIIDTDHKCVGVVTEGNVRNALLEGLKLNEPIEKVMNRNFVYVNRDDSRYQILFKFSNGIKHIPMLDDAGRPIDLFVYEKFHSSVKIEPRIIRARVPVRVSFAGGGTDMNYYINKQPITVLSSTINKYCTASVIVREDKEIHLISKDLDQEYFVDGIDKLNFGDKLDLIKAAIKIMNPTFGFDLETLSEFEPGTGLGGSSALTVAVIGALNYFRNENHIDLYNIADLSYQAERIDLGIHGGWQDQYATAFGGFNWIEFGKDKVVVNPLRIQREIVLELEYNLMLFRIGKSRNSGNIQNTYIENLKNNKVKKVNHYFEMAQIATKMKESLIKGRIKKFGDLLNDSWQLKKTMGSQALNSNIEEYYCMARNLGTLGGKLLGAGGSGYLLLHVSPKFQKSVKEALEENGAKQEPFKFSNHGLEVWSTPK